MEVNTDQFRALRTEAYEVKALRRALMWHEALIDEVEIRAEQRGFERGRAGLACTAPQRPARPAVQAHLGRCVVKGALLVVLVLAVAARTRLTGTVLGQPVSVPVLWLAAAVLVLVLAVLVLYLIWSIVRDWPEPRMVPA